MTPEVGRRTDERTTNAEAPPKKSCPHASAPNGSGGRSTRAHPCRAGHRSRRELGPDPEASSSTPELIKTTLTGGVGSALKNTVIYTACAFVIGFCSARCWHSCGCRRWPLPVDRDRLDRVLPWPAGDHRLHRVRPHVAGLRGLRHSRTTPTERCGSPSASSPRPTWPRPSGPESRRCRRGRSRLPVRWVCRPARHAQDRPAAGLPGHHSPVDERAHPPRQGLLAGLRPGALGRGLRADQVRAAGSSENASLTPLVVAGFCYLIITLPLSIIVRRMEARQKKER